LQSQCTDNQQFFKHSEVAEFFAVLCLVLGIFSLKFWSAVVGVQLRKCENWTWC